MDDGIVILQHGLDLGEVDELEEQDDDDLQLCQVLQQVD